MASNVTGASGVWYKDMSRPQKTAQQRLRRFVAIGIALVSGLAAAATLAQEPAPPPDAAVAQEPAPPAAPGQPPAAGFVLATGPGADAFQRACVLCHTPDRIVSVRRTKTEWEEVLDKMITRGAQITDENYVPIAEYLLRNYGKVNVNRAAKEDLVLVAGVAPAEAEGIVKFRAEHGNFADFAALVKVPGLDVKKLEQKKDALTF